MNGENDTMYYVHKDYLGSYDVITDESGNVLERLSFDPWGRRRNATDWTFNNLSPNHLFDRGYTGHEHLDVFSLINMNGRVYDPWLGRFLSPDPFVQSPGYSQSYNRYSYCFNNPLKYSDPSGYCAWKFEPADYIATFGGGYGAGIFRINWNQNLSTSGSYSYDWNTGTYRNSKGEEVTWDEVNGFIANESLTLTGVAAQSLYQNYTYGMNIYSISAFGRATLVSCFGELGPVEGSEEVGIYFNNPTAGAFIGETEVFDNLVADGGGDNFDNSKLALDIATGIYGGLRSIVTQGDYWLGTNGKYYSNSWGGNGYTGSRSGAIAAAKNYKWAGRATIGAIVIIGGIEVYNGYKKDGDQFGYNADFAGVSVTAGIIGGWAGAEAGATVGAAIGVWFGGVGAIPGAIIGGFVGGIVGSLTGNKIGEMTVNYYYGR